MKDILTNIDVSGDVELIEKVASESRKNIIKITILGSGSFFVDVEHSAPAYLLESNGKNILLDCGPGTQNQLAKIKFDPLDLDYIFITHFHADHTSDLFDILTRFNINYKFYSGKLKKLTIYGPKGLKNFVEKLADAYLLSSTLQYSDFEFIEYSENIKLDNLTIKPISVEHLGVDAFALRIELQNKVVTYTGDVVLSPGLITASKNADLLIADCATPKGESAVAHLSTIQVGEICRDNNVKKVILSHQVPPAYNVDMVGQVKEIFDGDVVLARDLMEIQL